MLKKIVFWLISLFSLSSVFAAVDLSLSSLIMPGGTGIYQNATSSVTLVIRNNGTDTAAPSTPISTWFISCTVWLDTVFSSNRTSSFIVNASTNIQFSITLSAWATKNLGNQELTCILWSYPWRTISSIPVKLSYMVLERVWGRFDTVLDQVREPIKNKIDWPIAEIWVWGLKSFVYSLIDRFAVRAAVFVGILFSLLAVIKIMFSEDEKSLSQVRGLIVWWVVGIFIILSAKFIGKIFYTDIFSSGEVGVGDFNMIKMIGQLYDLILYPLLKIAFYLMMSVLFVVLVLRVFSFVTSSEEDIRKKSLQIIISTTLWLFIIIASKQLVEWVYGKEVLIRNTAAVTVTDVWSSFLSNANIPIIYDIVQRVMGLSWFVILALIIFQTFKMLTNPTDEKVLWDIRKTLFYALLGMLVIWAGYLIVNVVMVN